jgi:NADP-dependent 3-hydroxy acid dehydrogenase YdfG
VILHLRSMVAADGAPSASILARTVARRLCGQVMISGSTVLLTGASGGLGQAIARALYARGAELRIVGRRTEVLERLAAELDGAVATTVDFSEQGAVARLIEQAGDTDILVANAGIPAAGRLESFTPADVDRTLEVNLRTPVALSHALLPQMLERGRGHLLFVSSIAGKMTVPGDPLYHATKYGLRGFAAGLRHDLHGSGVGVSCIFPGFIRNAGIFADSGVKLPPGVGTRSPVASITQRGGVVLAGLAPDLAATLIRRLGGSEVALEMDQALRDKR